MPVRGAARAISAAGKRSGTPRRAPGDDGRRGAREAFLAKERLARMESKPDLGAEQQVPRDGEANKSTSYKMRY